MEDFTIHSRWQETGAGRTDYQLTGGDVARRGIAPVTVSECWDIAFLSHVPRMCRTTIAELGRGDELLVPDRFVPVAFALGR